MELYEAMNERIADIITASGDHASLYASAYIKELRAENARLKDEVTGLTGALEAKQTDCDNLTRTLEETNENLKFYAKEIAQEIYDLCREHGTAFIVKYLKEKYGVQ